MALDIDASALLVYRSAWTKDVSKTRVTREAAMAKLFATERAQSVIDKAVQLFGGLGVTKGVKVEELYREIRALRIYEGASEVQKIVIARQHFRLRARRKSMTRKILQPPGWPRPEGYCERHRRERGASSSPPASSAGTPQSNSPEMTSPGSSGRCSSTLGRSSLKREPSPRTSCG